MANLFTSQLPSLADVSEPGGITTASTLVFAQNGLISGIRFYASITVGGGYTVALYQVTASDPGGSGTLLGSKVSAGSPVAGSWNTVSFDSAISVTAGIPYRAALFSAAGHYVATVGFWASQVVNGDITGVQAGTVNGGFNINQGTFATGGALAYPALSSGSACYFIDVEFIAGSGPVDKTSSATHLALASLAGTSSGGTTTGPEVTGMGPVYTTRERVMRAADIAASAYRNAEIDAAIEAGARRIDDLCKRGDATRPGFAPWTGTISFDWPSETRGNIGSSYRLWLAPHALSTLTAATSNGVAITANSYGWPVETGAPYPALAINRSSSSYLDPGSASGQRSAAVTGVWMGCPVAETARTNWTLGASVADSSTSSVTVNAPFGVGQILRVDSERMIVNDRTWSASGQTCTLAASNAADSIAVADGTAFFAGEELVIDSERVWVRDVVGNSLVVRRAVSGSTLAAHTSAAIMWSRQALVERGALGTTPAAHANGARVYFHKPPSLIEQLNVAYAIDQREQETSGYARTVGQGEAVRTVGGAAIRRLEDAVVAAHGRQIRQRAV